MSQKRRPGTGTLAIEPLEDRSVPSSGMASAQAAPAVNGTASLVDRLNAIGGQVDAAYSAFATGVRQAELELFNANLSAPPGTGPEITPADTAVRVGQQIATLSAALVADVGAQPAVSVRAASLLLAELTGPSPGSLTVRLAALLGAASPSGPSGAVPISSFPLLFTAVDGAIDQSHAATAVGIYYYATGQTGAIDTGFDSNILTNNRTTVAFDPTALAAQENAAYAALATSVRQAEVGLTVPDFAGGPVSQAGGRTAVAVPLVAADVVGLAQALESGIAATGTLSRSGPFLALIDGATPGSLANQLNGLILAANINGGLPSDSIPLLFAAVDGAIDASYQSTAVNTFLLAFGSSSG